MGDLVIEQGIVPCRQFDDVPIAKQQQERACKVQPLLAVEPARLIEIEGREERAAHIFGKCGQ